MRRSTGLRFGSIADLVRHERNARRKINIPVDIFDEPEVRYIEVAPNIFVPDIKPGPSSQYTIPDQRFFNEWDTGHKTNIKEISSASKRDLRRSILEKRIHTRVFDIETTANKDMCKNDIDSLKLLPSTLNDLNPVSKENGTVVTKEIEQAENDDKAQNEKVLSIFGNGIPTEECNIESAKDELANKDMCMNKDASQHLLPSPLNVSVSKEEDTVITKEIEQANKDKAQREKILSIFGNGIPTEECKIESAKDELSNKVSVSKEEDNVIIKEIEQANKDKAQREKILSIFGNGISTEECDIESIKDEFPNKDIFSVFRKRDTFMFMEKIDQIDKDRAWHKNLKRSIFENEISTGEYGFESIYDEYPNKRMCQSEIDLSNLPSTVNVSVSKNTRLIRGIEQSDKDNEQYKNFLRSVFGSGIPTTDE